MAGKPKMMERDGVGEAIQKARLKAGLTQKQLADIIGIRQNDITRYEQTGRIRDQKRFAHIAKTLGTTTDHLLGLDEPISYYQIKDGKMRKFTDFVDEGIEDLPEAEVRKIAEAVNDMIDQALKNTPDMDVRSHKPRRSRKTSDSTSK